MFMISACLATILLFHPAAPAVRWIPSAAGRRMIMGILMGLTAVGIIKCPWGRKSGAHFNPAITLTFLRLGKIRSRDAAFYVVFQFLGGIAGVGLVALPFGRFMANPSVEYAVTVPGPAGTAAAFAAEWFMSALLMAVVLITSNRPRLAPYTTYCMGILIAFYILLFAPVSGFSINPARTTGSAVFAGVWTAVWVYFTAPLLGMLFSAEVYVRLAGITEPHPLKPGMQRRRLYFSHRRLASRFHGQE